MLSKDIERRGTSAVIQLREKKLRNGQPFMINSKELPGNQAYLEYPDGHIVLVTVMKGSRNFTILHQLSELEGTVVRKKYLPI